MDSLIVHCLSLGQDVYVKMVLCDTLNLLSPWTLPKGWQWGKKTKLKYLQEFPVEAFLLLLFLVCRWVVYVWQGKVGWLAQLPGQVNWPSEIPDWPSLATWLACPAIRERLPAWPVWMDLKSQLEPWAGGHFSPCPRPAPLLLPPFLPPPDIRVPWWLSPAYLLDSNKLILNITY